MTAETALVAAYLRHVRGCDVVLTDVPLSDGVGPLGALGLEIDDTLSVAWLCATTADGAVECLRRAISFAEVAFDGAVPRPELWAPDGHDIDVPDDLPLTLVAGEDFDARVGELVAHARRSEPVEDDATLRLLQLVGRLSPP